MSDLDDLQSKLGYRFRDVSLLRLALTHPSVAHDNGETSGHNQRLEFLGDAVLQLIFTRYLYDSFPTSDEGPLTKARAQLVNRRTLADHGRTLELGKHLILSRGEELNRGRERPSALADAFEALIGAIFMDGGFDAAEEFLLSHFRKVLGELSALPNLANPKGELQEILQARSPDPVQYRLESVTGPEHDRLFECTVQYRGAEIGRGCGKSKKEAESRAAMAALANLSPADAQPAE